MLYTPLAYNPDEYFLLSYEWTFALETAAIVLDMLNADAVLLYRVWIVWGKRWQFVAVNSLLWLASLAITVRLLQVQVAVIYNPNNYPILNSHQQWAVINQSLSFVQTVTATGLLATRLWLVNRTTARYKQGSLVPVIRIVVESGAIYALLLIVYILFSFSAKYVPTSFLITSLVSPTIGITFSLIIVRVGLNLTGEHQTTIGATPGNSHPSQPVNISVRREVEIETGDGIEEVSGCEDGKETYALRRRDSVSSHSL